MVSTHSVTLMNRTLGHLKRFWNKLPSSLSNNSDLLDIADQSAPDQVQLAHVGQQMQSAINGVGGEMAARNAAADLGRFYLRLNPQGKQDFLLLLANDFDVDYPAINQLVGQWDSANPNIKGLKKALNSPRLSLLKLFNALPEGVKFLVDMRADLIQLQKHEPSLKPLQEDLRDLLGDWFDLGFLELKQMTWQHTPAELLEKLIQYEAVHAIDGWDDLRNRLDSDRRCFGFFHPQMPNEPLIFIEVALVQGMASNINQLLDQSAPIEDTHSADTAIFYSISNTQQGLASIGFGNYLIKNVVAELVKQHSQLQHFATLSPIPGLRKWLNKHPTEVMELLSEQQLNALNHYCNQHQIATNLEAVLVSDWSHNAEDKIFVESLLLTLGQHYITQERSARGTALDPVAHFHLSNGATAGRLNFMANMSPKGLQESAGMMINYVYNIDQIETNCINYSEQGVVAHSL